MKKFVSTLTSLCMSVSLTAGTLAAFSTAAADVSSVPVEKTLKMLADGKANYTISAEEIAAGDVTIEVGVYLEESDATTGTVRARFGVSEAADSSAIEITKVHDIYTETVDSYEYTFVGGANDGKTVTTTSRLAFYGTYKAVTKKVSNMGGILYQEVSDGGQVANFIYSAATNAPKWLGAKSDEFPVTTFDVVIKKGAAAGDYKIDFENHEVPGTAGSCTELGFADLTITRKLDNLLEGGLGEAGITITVEGEASSSTTTTTATTASSSKTTTTTTATTASSSKATTTTTTTTSTPDKPAIGEGLAWKVDDVKVTREELQANDGYVVVPVKVAQLADMTIAGAALTFRFPEELVWDGANADTQNAAYGNCNISINETIPKLNWVSIVYDENGKAQGIKCEEEGAYLMQLCFKLDTNVPDGKYDIEMFLDPETKDDIVQDNNNTHADVQLLSGSITIGDVQEPSSSTTTTTSTTKASSTTTTTTTKAPGSSTTTTKATGTTSGDVLYGDSNVDGKVNIADVVCLNQYLVDNAKYDLTAQGKINAEVNLDGKLTAADSTSIIKSLVKLVTLPDKA